MTARRAGPSILIFSRNWDVVVNLRLFDSGGGGGLALSGLEKLLVVLLGLQERVLEEICVFIIVSSLGHATISVTGHGLTLGVGEADGQGNGLSLALADIGGGVPHPAAVGTDVGGQLHLGND